MKKNKQTDNKIKYMLVFRDENLKVVKYEEDFNDYDSALLRRSDVEDAWVGEVVLCTGSSKEDILNAYPEYRMSAELVISSSMFASNDIEKKLIEISEDLLRLGVVLDAGAGLPKNPIRPTEHIVGQAIILGRHSDRLYVAVRNYVILKGRVLNFAVAADWIANSTYPEDDRRAASLCLSGFHKKVFGCYLFPAEGDAVMFMDYPSRGFLSNSPNLDQEMLGAGLRVLRNQNEGVDRYLGPGLIADSCNVESKTTLKGGGDGS